MQRQFFSTWQLLMILSYIDGCWEGVRVWPIGRGGWGGVFNAPGGREEQTTRGKDKL